MIIRSVEKISVKNFRNLENQIVELKRGINCVFGQNGNGKTNLLEAIYFLANRKSFKKNTSFPQILSLDSEEPEILFQSLLLNEKEEKISYSAKINNTKNEYYYNGRKAVKKPFLPTVFLNPFDSYSFHLQASARRQWIDNYFSLLSETYKSCLSKYNQAIKFRNSLVSKKPNEFRKQLKAIDYEVAKYSIDLIQKRQDLLIEINEYLSATFMKLFSEEHELKIVLETKFVNLGIEEIYARLQDGVEKDLVLGHTNYGVHRDDYTLFFDDYNAYEICSLGQQKMSYLSLIFAYIELFKYKFKTYPVVLIDDVSGELDKVRWGNLISYLSEKEFQTLITTANDEFKSELEKIEGAQRFLIREGNIETLI